LIGARRFDATTALPVRIFFAPDRALSDFDMLITFSTSYNQHVAAQYVPPRRTLREHSWS